MRVLLVEDEQSIREVERLYLERAGFSVVEAADGLEAISLWDASPFDLAILDINLPQRSGLEVCKHIRTRSQIPIIMVTARVEEIDELLGLESGADDYIKKPFSPAVLVARVTALLRRTGKTEQVQVGELLIDVGRQEVRIGEVVVQLSTMPFRILQVLASNPGRIYSRSELLDLVYGDDAGEIYDRTIDAHIHAIRTAIEPDPKSPKHLQTVIGRGYKVVA